MPNEGINTRNLLTLNHLMQILNNCTFYVVMPKKVQAGLTKLGSAATKKKDDAIKRLRTLHRLTFCH